MPTYDAVKQQQVDPFLKVIIKKLPINAKIGEVYCGSGSTIRFLTPYQEWYGADVHKELLKTIKAGHKSDKIHVRYGTLSPHLDFPDNCFDVLVCHKTYTVANLREAIPLLLAKAAYGGKVILIDATDAEKASTKEKRLWKERDVEEALKKYRGFAKH